jgi:signal transduction histidine kinase
MNKLQTRLIISFTFVIVVILCGVSTIFSLLLIRLPQQERLTYLELNTQARSMLTLFRRLPNMDYERIADAPLLDDFARRQETRIAWATADRQVVFDSEHIWDVSSAENIFAKLKPDIGKRWIGQVLDSGRLWLVVAHPAPDQTDINYYLILAKPISRPILTTLAQLRDTVGAPLSQAGIIALTVGLILSISISRSIAKPLSKVSQAARILAEGNYEVRVETNGPQEVQDLARSFNEMARQLHASHQAQNDLVANIAHDLRTPLTSIQGYAQALVDGTAHDDDNRQQAAQTIYDESRRMQKMTKTLLDLAKFQAGEVKLHCTDVDVVQRINERIDFYQMQTNDANISVVLNTLLTSLTIQADNERFVQVIDNLISNAIEYTPPGGKITIDVIKNGGRVVITITDTGVGIPKQELPRIFERFYRGDKSRHGTGTGLGLSIAKEIIVAHKGMIEVESIEGVGSKFTVTLPIASI